MTVEKQISLSARLKGLGFTKGNQMKLYGEVFELMGNQSSSRITLFLWTQPSENRGCPGESAFRSQS